MLYVLSAVRLISPHNRGFSSLGKKHMVSLDNILLLYLIRYCFTNHILYINLVKLLR